MNNTITNRQGWLAASAALLLATVFATGQAQAAETARSLEAALASAKAAGKPLLVEFGATWCGPCKALARDAATPAGKAALSGVVFVSYDVDGEPGAALSAKYGIEALPTLVAMGPDGVEAARRTGYQGGIGTLGSWAREIPLRLLPVERLLADRDPRAQLVAGRRLAEAGRRIEAAAAYRRAASGPADVAPEAVWALARIGAVSARDSIARREAVKVASKWPASDAAEHAALWLAADPKAPVVLLDSVFATRARILDDADSVNGIVYAAIKAKAWKGAEAAAQRLREIAPTNPQYIDTVAEVAHAQGHKDEAVAAERRAIALASPAARERLGLDDNLARFMAADGTPSRDVSGYEAPALEERAERPAPSRAAPGWVAAQRAMVEAVRAKCAPMAGDAVSFYGYVVGGQKPADNVVVPRPGTAPAFAACAEAAIRGVELEAGRAIDVSSLIVPMGGAFDEALHAAADRAKADCSSEAAGLASVEVVLVARRGQRPSVTVASGPERLRGCVSRAFAGMGAADGAAIRLATVDFGGAR